MMLIVTSQESLNVPTFSILKVMCSTIGNQFCLLSLCKCNGRMFCSSAATDSHVALTPPSGINQFMFQLLHHHCIDTGTQAIREYSVYDTCTLQVFAAVTAGFRPVPSASLLLQPGNLILRSQNQVQTQKLIQ